MRGLGATTREAEGGTVWLLDRETVLKAATKHKISAALGHEWVALTERGRRKSSHLATLLLLLFMLHAPVSQRLFHYFACQPVGVKSFLRADYTLECEVGDHAAFTGVVLLFLVVFTFAFPLGRDPLSAAKRWFLNLVDR